MSDIHGEYEAFSHVMRNGSGAVRKKIDDVFGHTLSNQRQAGTCHTLIYYPKEKIRSGKKNRKRIWKTGIRSLFTVLLKYARPQLPNTPDLRYAKHCLTDYAYVIEELITEKAEVLDKEAYYDSIVEYHYPDQQSREFYHCSVQN